MAGEILFDTNAVSAWIEADRGIFRAMQSNSPVVTIISVGELEYGVTYSARQSSNRERLEQSLLAFRVLLLDVRTAYHYGVVHTRLRKKGRPIPSNDIWIAALSIQHHLPLLTRDRHFENVDGIQLNSW